MHTIYIRIRVFSETSPKASEAFIFYFRFRTFNLEVKAKNRTYPLKCFGDEVNIGLFFFSVVWGDSSSSLVERSHNTALVTTKFAAAMRDMPRQLFSSPTMDWPHYYSSKLPLIHQNN
jgi:hypothetical protein